MGQARPSWELWRLAGSPMRRSNLSVVFRCEKGERISISAGSKELMESGCPKNGTATYGERGMGGSKPVGEISETELVIRTTVTHGYLVDAAFGPVR